MPDAVRLSPFAVGEPVTTPEQHTMLGGVLLTGRLLCSCGKVLFWGRREDWAGHLLGVLDDDGPGLATDDDPDAADVPQPVAVQASRVFRVCGVKDPVDPWGATCTNWADECRDHDQPAQDAARAARSAREASAPTRVPARLPVPPEYAPAALEAARQEDVLAHRARRRFEREQLGIPTTNVVQTKSRLGRTTEYQTIVKRRQRARAKGLDPDAMGARYRLPHRDTKAEARTYRDLVTTGRRAGLIGPD